ncbi:MAG: ribbon-helix-helix domain-containing protein [Ahrensia sp.]|nr:ribbon-helix-helix domain-containing protein [Ahrensia sp.]
MPLRKHSVSIRGHRTSFSLEDEFWQELRTIAKANGSSLAALVTRIDAKRQPGENLSSTLRLHVLRHLRETAGLGRSQQPE